MNTQSDKEIIAQFFEVLREDVIANQKQKGIFASGASADALRVETPEDNVGQLIDALGYFPEQEYGRGPTQNAGGGSGTLQQAIYAWLEFKKYGFDYQNDKQRKSLSWAIATTIHKNGTLAFRLGKQTGVLTEILTQDRVDSLAGVFAKKYSTEIRSDVIETFKS